MKKHLRAAIIGVFALAGLAIVSFCIFEYKAAEVPESECKIVEGKVVAITTGGINDAVFQLDGNQAEFYINRGLEKYTLAELEQKLLDRKVRLYFVDRKSLLDINNRARPIRKLELENQQFYTEF